MASRNKIWSSLTLLLLSVCDAVNPGLKARISQTGLNYAASVAVDIMTANLQHATIPDQTGSADITVGKVDYEFRNMKVTNFGKPGTAVSINTGTGLSWTLTGASVSLHGDWHYEYRLGFIKIKDSGSFDVSASGASGTISVTLGASQTGEPTIQSTGCSFHIDNLSVSLHGGASWLYDLFVQFIKDPLRDNIEKKVCEAASKAINEDAARELATLKVQVIIDKQWLLDYQLVSPPTFQPGFMESYHKGEFFYYGQEVEAPFQPASLPSPATADHMINFLVSDYLLNTAGYVLHQHGVLAYDLTQKDLPADEKVFLNTTCCLTCQCLGKLLPVIGKTYPDASIEAQMSTSEPPTVNIDSTNVFGNFSGIIILSARLSNGSLAYLFKVKVGAKVTVLPTFNGTVLRASVSKLDETIAVVDSQIGPVSDNILLFFFNYAKKAFIIPQLNIAGARGFPLPQVDHINFINTAMQLMPNCVSLQTDVQYKSQTLYFQP